MRVYGDVESVNLSTGERFRRVVGNGESRLESSFTNNTRLGPGIEREMEVNEITRRSIDKLIRHNKEKRMEGHTVLRLKMLVNNVTYTVDGEGNKSQEQITLSAVCSNRPDSMNSKWSKWTPNAQFNMIINNPEAFGKVLPGQFMFVDLTLSDKDTL